MKATSHLVKRGKRYNSMIGRRAKSAFHRACFFFLSFFRCWRSLLFSKRLVFFFFTAKKFG